MNEVTSDDPHPLSSAGRPPPPRPPISDISVWIEKFSTMAALLAQRFPEKAPELFAYQALIVRSERNYRGRQWVSYDRAFRREALASNDLNWSVPNQRLYQEAFTGRARDIPRCDYCLGDDHGSETCLTNPNRASYPQPHWAGPTATPTSRGGRRPSPSQELCIRFNKGQCRLQGSKCRYTHACRECQGGHPALHCPRAHGRSRSPVPRPRY